MTPPSEGRGCPVWAKLLMIASLTINLVVLGLILGHRIKDQRTVQNDWVMYIVPEEKRDAARALLAKNYDQQIELRSVKRDLRDAMTEALKDEAYRASDMAPLLEEYRGVSNELRRIRHQQFISVIDILNHDERVYATDLLQERFPRKIVVERKP